MLYGEDDGASDRDEMLRMVEASYRDGTRLLCLTPHYHPGCFGDNREKTAMRFTELWEEAAVRWPDLKLVLSNELRYSTNCVSWIREGKCRPLGNTRYLLVDYREHEHKDVIIDGLKQILNSGYRPVLAHAERYESLRTNWKIIRALKEYGVLIQADTQSLFRGFGWRSQRMLNKLLKYELVDFFGSDAHDTESRPPEMSEAYDYVERNYGKEYAEKIFRINLENLIG